jgi:hypothetical protein
MKLAPRARSETCDHRLRPENELPQQSEVYVTTWLKQTHGEYVIDVMPFIKNGPRGTWAYAGAISKNGGAQLKFGSEISEEFSDQATAATEGFYAAEDLIKRGEVELPVP